MSLKTRYGQICLHGHISSSLLSPSCWVHSKICTAYNSIVSHAILGKSEENALVSNTINTLAQILLQGDSPDLKIGIAYLLANVARYSLLIFEPVSTILLTVYKVTYALRSARQLLSTRSSLFATVSTVLSELQQGKHCHM